MALNLIREIFSCEEIDTLTGHSDAVTSLVFSPDGQTLVSGSRDSTIKVWRIQ
ncbi:MAG: WD40 domain-containing protein [Nostoc indistinguendum CM1-VF10]|nr:WD40 domain-containing protein [Nostoc indistinguendum CM1-VF10]